MKTKELQFSCPHCRKEIELLLAGKRLFTPMEGRSRGPYRTSASKVSRRYKNTKPTQCRKGCGRVFMAPQGRPKHEQHCKGGK